MRSWRLVAGGTRARLGAVALVFLALASCGGANAPSGGGNASQTPSGTGARNGEAVISASPAASADIERPAVAPTATPAPRLPTATPTAAPLPQAKRIGPLPFISQTLNNCGPASIAEVLSYYGVQRSQAQVASVLRPDLPDYGMSLYGVPFYAESVGMKATGGIDGTAQLVKAFVANGLPVIVADMVSPTDHTRHFRPIDGYDDQAGYFIGSDPYLGPNHKISYADFDAIWTISTERWVVIYPPDKQPLVDSIVRAYWSKSQAIQVGLQKAQERMAQQPRLPWTWLELADTQIDAGDLQGAAANIQKGSQLGLPFEAHWLQMKLQRAASGAA